MNCEQDLRFNDPGAFACINLCDDKDTRRYDTGQILLPVSRICLHMIDEEMWYERSSGFMLHDIIQCIIDMGTHFERTIESCAVCSDDEHSDLSYGLENGVIHVYVSLND